jgi:succinate dehydrogenase/fumarate reductase flavoprotein subunit
MMTTATAGIRTYPLLIFCLLPWLSACERYEPGVQLDADVIVVGAGLAGLSAAIDAASSGAEVLIIDMNSVFGGHGIQSGGVAVVNSPMQAAMGFQDTPDLAYRDWMDWTIDGHAEWTRFYVEHSRELIYDWVTGLGARFDRIIPSHGNSVPRFHMTYRRGLNLTRPLYLEALRYSNITFQWNMLAQHLIKHNDRVAGVEALELRRGEQVELHAASVIIATGGFQSNIAMVKENWHSDLPAPEQIYSMSGQNSRGTGHLMAQEAGAALVHMDRQYNGYAALPNVLGLDDERGFVGGNSRTIWVNNAGERFVTEGGIDRDVFPVVMQQQPPGYWHIFDDDDKDGFRINSPHFVSAEAVDRKKIERLLIDNSEVTTKGDTIEELAERIGVPPGMLAETVSDYNALVNSGDSTDVSGMPAENPPPVFTIDTPPFYALRSYPMANKSAGGISIDLGTRALDSDGRPVPGLYAAGEVTGSAGMNGLNGLDGMFTGPSILTGRVAGRTVVADLAAGDDWTAGSFTRDESPSLASASVSDDDHAWTPNLDADDLEAMLSISRDGYWHFERSHQLVLERAYDCTQCHFELLPFAPATTRPQKLAQAETCNACHLAPAGTLDPTSHQDANDKPDR